MSSQMMSVYDEVFRTKSAATQILPETVSRLFSLIPSNYKHYCIRYLVSNYSNLTESKALVTPAQTDLQWVI
jgi:hypothetical protein